jgi:hypothetical protein
MTMMCGCEQNWPGPRGNLDCGALRAAFQSSQPGTAHHGRFIEGLSGERISMRNVRFLLVLLLLAIPACLFGQIGVRIAIGPPPLPIYEQPLCPGDGYLWTPGYWAYDDGFSDYYWVPGTWVLAPEEGFLWTPGFWGWGDGGFFFTEGYWGPTVGFYGGINYGFGYFGEGFVGGRWDHGHFFYNRTVSNVDGGTIHNVYEAKVENHNNKRVSYNGGKGGIKAHPNAEQEAAAKERHLPPVSAQTEHAQAARSNPSQRAGVNHGQPGVTATARPGDFSANGAAGARETAEPSRPANGGKTAIHPNDLPPIEHPAPVNSGDAKADQKYQKEQEKLIAKQTKEREKLQQKQEAEHQKQANANNQKLEQKHQQQTQKLAQRHAAEMQSLQARQPQPRMAAPAPRR